MYHKFSFCCWIILELKQNLIWCMIRLKFARHNGTKPFWIRTPTVIFLQICKTESARLLLVDGSAILQKLSFCKLVQAGWVSARLNVQILASQCGPARTAFACKNWRTGPAKLAQLGRAEAIGQCKSELRSLFAPKRALLFCYFCPRVNTYSFVLGCKFPNKIEF